MNFSHTKIIHGTVFLVALLLSACGGGGGGATASAPTYPIASQMGGAMQGIALNLTPSVSTLAGAAPGADGTGAAARFSAPSGVVSDGANLYVADTLSNKIRKVVIATGAVTTLAGAGAMGAADGAGTAATFNNPRGITSDGTNLYVADTRNHKIRQIVIATGAVSSLTGVANTAGMAGAVDGAAAAATLSFPYGITSDGTNLYVADMNNNKIRQIVIATGAVSSLTGVTNTAGAMGAVDGAGTAATFNGPQGITSDGTNLYVADTGNHKIRKIVIATGAVSSFTGVANSAGALGAADGTGTAATFGGPQGITTDGTNLYVADANNNKIRKIVIATGAVSSFTGVANTAGAAGAADGAAAAATFNLPLGITTVGGMLYVADTYNYTIRTVALSTATVTTLAGNALLLAADGTGGAVSFYSPGGITSDGSNLYVADTRNHKIRKILIATGAVTTLAGTGAIGAADGAGTAATFNLPWGITTDGSNLYVADSGNNKIRKIVIATGAVSSFTGVANTAGAAGAADGAAAAATFNTPQDITTDGTSLYVADTGNHKIRKIVIATGAVSSLTGVANTAGVAGAADGAAAAATFNYPQGITTDGSNLYVTDTNNNKIRKIVIATGAVSSLTGVANTAGAFGAADGAAAAATFNYPQGITTDGSSLYVADSGNNKIRKIMIATGAVSSLTGGANIAGVGGAADGAGTVATFNNPYGITSDGSSLYVTDMYNSTIRKIQ